MKKIMVPGLVFAFLVLFASGLHAQKLYIGGFAGYSSSTPKLPGADEFDPKASLFYGGRLGLKISMLAIEATYIRSDYEIVQTVTGVVDWNGETLEYQYVGVNVKLFPFSLAIFKPYITGGYGIYLTEISNGGILTPCAWGGMPQSRAGPTARRESGSKSEFDKILRL